MKKKGDEAPSIRKRKEYESLIGPFRLDKGLTVQELADKSGVSLDLIVKLNNGLTSPVYVINRYGRKDDWKPCARKIAKALDAEVEALFPRYICLPERSLTKDQIVTLSMGTTVSRSAEQLAAGREFLEKFFLFAGAFLKNNEAKIFRLFSQGYDIAEIAQEIGCTCSNIYLVIDTVRQKLALSWNSQESRINGPFFDPKESALSCEQ